MEQTWVPQCAVEVQAIFGHQRTIIRPFRLAGSRTPSAWDGVALLLLPHPRLELSTSWSGVMCYDG